MVWYGMVWNGVDVCMYVCMYVMFCYVMLCVCYVMLCYVMLCYVMVWYGCMYVCMHACMYVCIHACTVQYPSAPPELDPQHQILNGRTNPVGMRGYFVVRYPS